MHFIWSTLGEHTADWRKLSPYLYTRVHVIVDVIVFQHTVPVVIEIYTNLKIEKVRRSQRLVNTILAIQNISQKREKTEEVRWCWDRQALVKEHFYHFWKVYVF